jgi:hypothetical protein
MCREGYNGQSAWRQDPSGAPATLTGDEAVLTEAIFKSRNARSFNYGKALQRSPHLDVAAREDSDSHDGGD